MRIHSLLSPKCHVARSGIDGRGVFAGESFRSGEIVAVWGGKVYTAEECARLGQAVPHMLTHTISLCEGYYLGSENLFEMDDSELFNHSCEPNLGVQGQVIVVARRDISQGEELTFDYDTTETEADPFLCHCGSRLCRGSVDGSAWLDDAFVKRNWAYLSWHVQESVRRRRRLCAGHGKDMP